MAGILYDLLVLIRDLYFVIAVCLRNEVVFVCFGMLDKIGWRRGRNQLSVALIYLPDRRPFTDILFTAVRIFPLLVTDADDIQCSFSAALKDVTVKVNDLIVVIGQILPLVIGLTGDGGAEIRGSVIMQIILVIVFLCKMRP